MCVHVCVVCAYVCVFLSVCDVCVSCLSVSVCDVCVEKGSMTSAPYSGPASFRSSLIVLFQCPRQQTERRTRGVNILFRLLLKATNVTIRQHVLSRLVLYVLVSAHCAKIASENVSFITVHTFYLLQRGSCSSNQYSKTPTEILTNIQFNLITL